MRNKTTEIKVVQTGGTINGLRNALKLKREGWSVLELGWTDVTLVRKVKK